MDIVQVYESTNSKKVQHQVIAEAPRSTCSKNHNPPSSNGKPEASVPFLRKEIDDDKDRATTGRKQKTEETKSSLKETEERVTEEAEPDREISDLEVHEDAPKLDDYPPNHEPDLQINDPEVREDASRLEDYRPNPEPDWEINDPEVNEDALKAWEKACSAM